MTPLLRLTPRKALRRNTEEEGRHTKSPLEEVEEVSVRNLRTAIQAYALVVGEKRGEGEAS